MKNLKSLRAYALLFSLMIATAPAWAGKAITGVVNINTATQQELTLLPGVGVKKAEAIVAARPFKTPADIVKVKGIGPKQFEKMQGSITTEGSTTAKLVKAAKKEVVSQK
ncbi:MAG: helix-hairpin-helix domain-containing protein [bacterium]|nr:helix-hairpin-helix domain-containing protein [bacterium]